MRATYIYILMNEYSRRRRFVRGRVQATCDNGRRREEYKKPCAAVPKTFLVNRRTFFWKREKKIFSLFYWAEGAMSLVQEQEADQPCGKFIDEKRGAG